MPPKATTNKGTAKPGKTSNADQSVETVQAAPAQINKWIDINPSYYEEFIKSTLDTDSEWNRFCSLSTLSTDPNTCDVRDLLVIEKSFTFLIFARDSIFDFSQSFFLLQLLQKTFEIMSENPQSITTDSISDNLLTKVSAFV